MTYHLDLSVIGGGCLLQVPVDYAPIRQDYEDFYTRRMYYRLHVSIDVLLPPPVRLVVLRLDCVIGSVTAGSAPLCVRL